jgi:hypothetical protein
VRRRLNLDGLSDFCLVLFYSLAKDQVFYLLAPRTSKIYSSAPTRFRLGALAMESAQA